ncbi:hypothetical protein [Thermocrinis minervae]|uniref:Lipoprotein n=1 Tax=Thermocrinis minervae TaxID=381751 RepID=A0A1M6SX21_9AQUI|nr:hypothetical protein [Thermocrinis minervae]SHK49118.1 hypothetical protein SAMN05444391_1198 [Thermocrinis minervae]
MKKLALLAALVLLYSCAPLVCPEASNLQSQYSVDNSPKSYRAKLFVRYGLLGMPMEINKDEKEYSVTGLKGELIKFTGKRICLTSACFDLPVGPDGIIFGKVLDGDEKVECSLGKTIFYKDEGQYVKKVIFSMNTLERVELLDKHNGRTISVEYPTQKVGSYYRSVKIDLGDISLVVNVDEVYF